MHFFAVEQVMLFVRIILFLNIMVFFKRKTTNKLFARLALNKLPHFVWKGHVDSSLCKMKIVNKQLN